MNLIHYLPVINLSREEHGFSPFTDVHGSIDLPDSGGEAVLVDGAGATVLLLRLFNHPVLMTWRKHNPVTASFWDAVKNSNTPQSTARVHAGSATLRLHKAVICVQLCVLLLIQLCHADEAFTELDFPLPVPVNM